MSETLTVVHFGRNRSKPDALGWFTDADIPGALIKFHGYVKDDDSPFGETPDLEIVFPPGHPRAGHYRGNGAKSVQLHVWAETARP